MNVAVLDAKSAAVPGLTAADFTVTENGKARTILKVEPSPRADVAVIIDDDLIPESSLAGAVRALQLAGITAISARENLSAQTNVDIRQVAGEHFFVQAKFLRFGRPDPRRYLQRGRAPQQRRCRCRIDFRC